jgi:hypothetical protein
MGLLILAGPDRSAVKKPVLTPFGRAVLLEDPYFKTGVSQWVAHFNLCGPIYGADVWHHVFFVESQALGMSFPRSKLESQLSLVYGVKKGGLIGPLIGTYEDDAAFRTCGALSEREGAVVRKPAPISDDFGFAYGAWLLQLMTDHFAGTGQVSVTDLDAAAGWRTIPGWDIAAFQRALELVERKGLVEVDRHMDPWLLRPLAPTEETWKRIYSDLL